MAKTIETRARELLARTARDLRENGWHQGEYYPPEYASKWSLYSKPPQDCPACVYGAMIRASGRTFAHVTEVRDPVWARAEKLMRVELAPRTLLSMWNDREGQTAKNVIATLEKAAGPEALARIQEETA